MTAVAERRASPGGGGGGGLLLTLETATRACSAALFDGSGRLLGERTALDGPAHSQFLLAGVHAVLGAAGATMADVSDVVVSLGPGTFTGLRIGVATARALTLASGARLGGVPTLAALALALAAGEAGASAAASGRGQQPVCVPLIDGRRGEAFAARYRRASAGGAPLVVAEDGPAVVKAGDLATFLSTAATGGPVVTGGDGAVLYADRLPPAAVWDRAVAAPTAVMIGRAWLAPVPGVLEERGDVLPIYGRGPDARPRLVQAPV